MRWSAKILGCVLVLAAAGFGPAQARIPFGAGPIPSPRNYPGAPRPVYDDAKAPYAMNYTDEAAQTLGFRDGHMDVFSTKPAENKVYLPSFSGGLGGDGAMLKLQWHMGE
jgi:hypothetical protein